jgi:hypothetical protein
MKKIITLILPLIIFCAIYGFNSRQNFYVNGFNPSTQMVMIPDVMNKISVLEKDVSGFHSVTMDADSFPNFPGFPKHVAGSSFEGGIFCNMDSDPELEIVYNVGYTINAFNLDGSNVPGWPKTSSYPLEGAPSFGDIDGDGQGEIVATGHGLTSGGQIYAFKKNGNPVTGFPINHGYSTRTPVLADLDNNGTMEIIVNLRLYPVGEEWVYKGDGTVYPGWPKPLNHVPASSAAVGDITGDGQPEIIAESYISLYAWHANGDSLPGFPFTMPNSDANSYSSPVLADVDNDNVREIIFGTHVLTGGGYVYVLKNNGTILPGWPKSVSSWIYGPPAVGYIDGDNILDIAVGDQTLSSSPFNFIYAWNKNGTSLAGFPVGPLWAINDQVSLGDIDNDNMTELIVDDNTQTSGMGKYLAFNHDGTPVSGWPIVTTGTTFFNTPCLFDVNNNAILDILGGGVEGSGSFTNIYLWNTGVNLNPSKIYNPIWQYNERHNGVFGDNPLVGLNGNVTSIPSQFKLYQNYPNPFNPLTKIKVDIPSSSGIIHIQLKVYDILGRAVSTLVNQELKPGRYEFEWNAGGYPSGIYFYKLTGGRFSGTGKMILVK